MPDINTKWIEVDSSSTAEQVVQDARAATAAGQTLRFRLLPGAPEAIVQKLLATHVRPRVAEIWEDLRTMTSAGFRDVSKMVIPVNGLVLMDGLKLETVRAAWAQAGLLWGAGDLTTAEHEIVLAHFARKQEGTEHSPEELHAFKVVEAKLPALNFKRLLQAAGLTADACAVLAWPELPEASATTQAQAVLNGYVDSEVLARLAQALKAHPLDFYMYPGDPGVNVLQAAAT